MYLGWVCTGMYGGGKGVYECVWGRGWLGYVNKCGGGGCVNVFGMGVYGYVWLGRVYVNVCGGGEEGVCAFIWRRRVCILSLERFPLFTQIFNYFQVLNFSFFSPLIIFILSKV
jgi:hypothetical protein